jgi:CheY-like chemotaxis protein
MAAKPSNIQGIAQMQPDLVISDWGVAQDPNWNFISAMQASPRTAVIPIVVCTAVFLKADQLGVRLNERKVKVLEKPFDIEELLRLVENTISDPFLCEVFVAKSAFKVQT